MAKLLDTYFPMTHAVNIVLVSTCRQTPSRWNRRGYELALAARCAR
jgi:hypothetical protein